MSYKHLTYEQRVQIHTYLKAGYTIKQIASQLGVHRTTISREIKRNSGNRGYRFKQAQSLYVKRRAGSAKRIRFTADIQVLVSYLLRQDWSPAQISGWLRKYHIGFVSHETIYQFIIWDQKQGGDLYTHLRQGHRKRRRRLKQRDRRGRIPNRISIDERPSIVDTKERIGDWEIDTIIGKNHQGVLLTAVERKSKFTIIRALPNREAKLVAQTLIAMLTPYKSLVWTITSDNGKEFSQHEKIAKKLKAKFYFAHPYCSWERGLNENTNGLIRQYFPKKISLLDVTDEQVENVQYKLNHRPRKLLDFETPYQIFFNSLCALGT